jgi:probable rRNA maturation factor
MLDIQHAVMHPGCPDDAQLKAWCEAVLRRLGAVGDVTLRIVSEQESRALNARFRAKDAPTNVLSFPMSVPEHTGETLLGDIVICAPLVAREAREQGKSERAHWAHLVVHGLLHLLGYDHIDAADAQVMESLELALLAEFEIPNPYECAS